jgi:hypothetical protein
MQKTDSFEIYVSGANEISAVIYGGGVTNGTGDTKDGYLHYTDAATYAGARSSATGTVVDSSGHIVVGQSKSGTNFTIYRGGLYFDTSAIPDTDTILSATIYLHFNPNSSSINDTDQLVNIVSGSDLADGGIITGDYGEILNQGTIFSSEGDKLWTDGWKAFNLNASGIAEISKTGLTKFALRGSHDINNVDDGPDFIENNYYDFNDSNGSDAPYIAVTHTTGIADKTVTATSVSSEDIKVKVTADAANFKIYIDSGAGFVEKDSVALAGTSVLDTDFDIIWNQNNVMPYINYIKMQTGN